MGFDYVLFFIIYQRMADSWSNRSASCKLSQRMRHLNKWRNHLSSALWTQNNIIQYDSMLMLKHSGEVTFPWSSLFLTPSVPQSPPFSFVLLSTERQREREIGGGGVTCTWWPHLFWSLRMSKHQNHLCLLPHWNTQTQAGEETAAACQHQRRVNGPRRTCVLVWCESVKWQAQDCRFSTHSSISTLGIQVPCCVLLTEQKIIL